MEDLIIAENQFEQDLINLINNSNLPAFALEPKLKDVYQQVLNEKNRQLQEALALKEKQKEKQKEEEKEKKKEVKENAKN